MLMLWDWHPDVEEFITVKEDLSKINGANLSVNVSDAFMTAVKNDADWDLVYPELDDPMYDEHWDGDIVGWKARGGKVKVYKTVKARYLWDLICTAAWKSAEPGLHFLERSNKQSNTWYFEKLIATNPCGEQPLGGWAVCNLGAMNLAQYVKDEKFDYESFSGDVKVAMRLLDNVIDDTYYFFKENEKCAKEIRRTGLGIMGLADALIKMKLRYGSEEAMPTIEKIFQTLRDSAYEASSDIAKEKGSFPKFDKEKYLQGYHIKALSKKLREKIAAQGIRNAVLLTIAPTGTTSLLSGVSSGVEPVYEFTFVRRDRTGEHVMYHPLFEEWKNENPEAEKPNYFVSANDLTPLEHVRVQAVAQKYIDSSISKTVNAPNAHTIDDVKTLYMLAYEMGLKGITYMRDGSREGVLSRIEEKKKEEEAKEAAKEMPIRRRPVALHGVTHKTVTPLGHTFITINNDEEEKPFEIFINAGKSGSDVMAMAEALGRIMSMVLRIQSPVEPRERIRDMIDQLTGIGGGRSVGFGPNRVRSLPDAVAKVLAEHFEFRVNGHVADKKMGAKLADGPREVKADAPTAKEPLPTEESGQSPLPLMAVGAPKAAANADLCPECGSASFVHEEGCAKCYACGHAEC